MRFVRTIAFGIALVAAVGCGFADPALAQTSSTVVFTDYSPLSGNAELARRMLSPLTAAQLPQILARSGKALREQPIDLSQEKFTVYVPTPVPQQGYGLIVFVPPWQEAGMPKGWAGVLDQYGLIFVSAVHSGNEESVLGRREPLALLAEQNIVRRYKIDPQRIFIAGFSGGSRVAMRLALGYPDIFHGAILNAGADRIGDAQSPLPPRDLFLQFQTMHIVYVTGEQDTYTLLSDRVSMHSMRDWCVFNVDDRVTPSTGHESADATALSRALDLLLGPAQPDPDRLASCRAGLDAELDEQFRQVQSLITAGQRDAAQDLLKKIDERFGGFAAPRSVDLAASLAKP